MRIIPEWREYDAEIKRVIGGKGASAGEGGNSKEDDEKHEEL